LRQKDFDLTHVLALVERFKQFILTTEVRIPICMQHGDFDICNLLRHGKQLHIIDFEHALVLATPWFDLVNLLYSPLLLEKKLEFGTSAISLQKYISQTNWHYYLQKWTKYYLKRIGIPSPWCKWLLLLSVIEQNAKQYPSSRDPFDYPLYGQSILNEVFIEND
jgi:thiamine kinase-like enzyme